MQRSNTELYISNPIRNGAFILLFKDLIYNQAEK